MNYPIVQTVKNLPAMQETRVRSLVQEDPPEKGMVTHSSILAWRIPWPEKPEGLQPVGSQRVGHNWVVNTHTHTHTHTHKVITAWKKMFDMVMYKLYSILWIMCKGGILMPTSFLENSLVKWFKIRNFKIFQKHMPLATVPFKFNIQKENEWILFTTCW